MGVMVRVAVLPESVTSWATPSRLNCTLPVGVAVPETGLTVATAVSAVG